MLADLYLDYLSHIILKNKDLWLEPETLRMGLEDTFIEYPLLRNLKIDEDFSISGKFEDTIETFVAFKAMARTLLQLLEMYVDENEAKERFAKETKVFFEEKYDEFDARIANYLPESIKDIVVNLKPELEINVCKIEDKRKENALDNNLKKDEKIEDLIKDIPKELIDTAGLDNNLKNDEKIEELIKDIPKELVENSGGAGEKDEVLEKSQTNSINENVELLENRKLSELKNDELPIQEWVRTLEIRNGLDRFFERYPESLSSHLVNGILDERIKYWSSKGINVNRLLNLKDEPTERIARGILIFEQDAVKLLMIKHYLTLLEDKGNDDYIFSLKSKLDDVVKLFVVLAEFERLLQKVKEYEEMNFENEIAEKIPSLYLSEKCKFWNSRGFNSEVLSSLSGLDMKQTHAGISEYENAICRLVSYSDDLSSIDPYMLEEETAKIKEMLKDVRCLDVIPNEIAKLKEKAKEIEKERQKISDGVKNRLGICPMCGSPVLRQALSCPVCRFTAFREFTTNKYKDTNADDNFEKEMKKELRKRRELHRLIALWTGKELAYSPNRTSSELELKFKNIVDFYNRMFLHVAHEIAYLSYLGLTPSGLETSQEILFSNLDYENCSQTEDKMLSRLENLKKELFAKHAKNLDMEREDKILNLFISEFKDEGFEVDDFISKYRCECNNIKTLIRELANTALILRAVRCEISMLKSLLNDKSNNKLCIEPSLLNEIDEILNISHVLSLKEKIIEKRDALFAKICETIKVQTEKEENEDKPDKAWKKEFSFKNERKEISEPCADIHTSKSSSIEVEEFRSHLREKIFEYESKGYNVEVLDNVLTLGLDEMKRALDDFESRAKRIEIVKDKFAKMDIVQFEKEAEELITFLTDVSYVEEAEKRLGEIELKIAESNKNKMTKVKKNDTFSKRKGANSKEIIDGKKLMKLALKGKK